MRSDEEIVAQIKELIETNIKPAVAGHGGVPAAPAQAATLAREPVLRVVSV